MEHESAPSTDPESLYEELRLDPCLVAPVEADDCPCVTCAAVHGSLAERVVRLKLLL